MKIVADENIPYVEECFGSLGEVRCLSGKLISPRELTDADVLLVRSVTGVNADLLAGSDVKFVGTATIGVDHVDAEYLKARDIGFASAPGSNANSVAEYVVAALLELAGRKGFTLQGKSIGVIGVGNVGSRVAAKAEAIGMEVVRNDPPLRRESGDKKYRPLAQALTCDVVTVHTPLTYQGSDRTYHLCGQDFFSSLKDGCVFLNTSRGAVADTGALKAWLKGGRAGGMVVDVWENEPSIDRQLLEMVDIGTPHIAGYSLDGKVKGMIMIYRAVCEQFNIEPRFDARDFLPSPEVEELTLDAAAGKDDQTLLKAVRAVYDIRDDAERLAKMTDKPGTERSSYFRMLRKQYPVRREFYNTLVRFTGGRVGDRIRKKLEGIGFRVADE